MDPKQWSQSEVVIQVKGCMEAGRKGGDIKGEKNDLNKKKNKYAMNHTRDGFSEKSCK